MKSLRKAHKHLSREKTTRHALDAAQHVEIAKGYDVCVVGGGASGLIAAICAAEAGARVALLEKNLSCGEPILATGNGRCNFCNVALSADHYNHPAFIEHVCGTDWLDCVLSFFRESGVRWILEDDRLYPISRQAASVRNALVARARKAGVTLGVGRQIIDIQPLSGSLDSTGMPANARWRLTWQGVWDAALPHEVFARSIVFCAGPLQVEALSSKLGIHSQAVQPVLTPLACESSPLLDLNGRRVHAIATLYRGNRAVRSERGEVLFRDYGLSGIVIFNLSRSVEPGDILTLDLTPDVGISELMQIAAPMSGSWQEASGIDGSFDGVLDPVIATKLANLAHSGWWLTYDERLNTPNPKTDLERMVALIKGLPFRVSGIAHPELAQIKRGGIAISELDETTLEVVGNPGLYIAGEAVDIDGDCGGFNLAWAWESGMIAGKAAAQ